MRLAPAGVCCKLVSRRSERAQKKSCASIACVVFCVARRRHFAPCARENTANSVSKNADALLIRSAAAGCALTHHTSSARACGQHSHESRASRPRARPDRAHRKKYLESASLARAQHHGRLVEQAQLGRRRAGDHSPRPGASAIVRQPGQQLWPLVGRRVLPQRVARSWRGRRRGAAGARATVGRDRSASGAHTAAALARAARGLALLLAAQLLWRAPRRRSLHAAGGHVQHGRGAELCRGHAQRWRASFCARESVP